MQQTNQVFINGRPKALLMKECTILLYQCFGDRNRQTRSEWRLPDPCRSAFLQTKSGTSWSWSVLKEKVDAFHPFSGFTMFLVKGSDDAQDSYFLTHFIAVSCSLGSWHQLTLIIEWIVYEPGASLIISSRYTSVGFLPSDVNISIRSSLSTNPSRFWSIMLNASCENRKTVLISFLGGARRSWDGLMESIALWLYLTSLNQWKWPCVLVIICPCVMVSERGNRSEKEMYFLNRFRRGRKYLELLYLSLVEHGEYIARVSVCTQTHTLLLRFGRHSGTGWRWLYDTRHLQRWHMQRIGARGSFWLQKKKKPKKNEQVLVKPGRKKAGKQTVFGKHFCLLLCILEMSITTLNSTKRFGCKITLQKWKKASVFFFLETVWTWAKWTQSRTKHTRDPCQSLEIVGSKVSLWTSFRKFAHKRQCEQTLEWTSQSLKRQKDTRRGMRWFRTTLHERWTREREQRRTKRKRGKKKQKPFAFGSRCEAPWHCDAFLPLQREKQIIFPKQKENLWNLDWCNFQVIILNKWTLSTVRRQCPGGHHTRFQDKEDGNSAVCGAVGGEGIHRTIHGEGWKTGPVVGSAVQWVGS